MPSAGRPLIDGGKTVTTYRPYKPTAKVPPPAVTVPTRKAPVAAPVTSPPPIAAPPPAPPISSPPPVAVAPPPTVTPPAPPALVVDPADPIAGREPTTALRDLTEAELNALLDTLASRYNLSREQLSASRGVLGEAARSLEARLERARIAATSEAREQSIERGTLRSGLHARDIAQINTAAAEQRLENMLALQAQRDEIDTQLARLAEQEQSEAAVARQAAEQGLLQFEEGQTIADLLAQLPLAPITPSAPILPGMPYIPNPYLPPPPNEGDLLAPHAPVTPTPTVVGGGGALPYVEGQPTVKTLPSTDTLWGINPYLPPITSLGRTNDTTTPTPTPITPNPTEISTARDRALGRLYGLG